MSAYSFQTGSPANTSCRSDVHLEVASETLAAFRREFPGVNLDLSAKHFDFIRQQLSKSNSNSPESASNRDSTGSSREQTGTKMTGADRNNTNLA